MDRTKLTARFFLVAFLLTVLIGMAIHGQLAADFVNARWQSLGTRLGLITSVACFLAWRLREADLFSKAGDRRRGLFCLFFLFVLIAPLLGQFSFLPRSIKDVGSFLYKQRQGSNAEKILHLVKNFPGTYQVYITQRFTTPLWYVHVNAIVKVHLLGISPNKTITMGKNGFFFEGLGASRVEKEIVENFDNVADYMGQIPFSEEELRQWKIALEQRSYWLKSRGSDYVFVLAPTKAFVYPEYLPDSIQRLRGRARYEQLSEYLQQYADIRFIDLLPPLLEAKRESGYPLLFYKTDFHWNFYGACIAYQAMVREMRRMFPRPELEIPELGDFEMKIDRNWAHQRFLHVLGLPLWLHRNEHHVTMVPRPGGLYDGARDIPAEGIYDVYPPLRKITAPDGKSMNIRLILNPQAPVASLALLGDSFLEKCVYFFSANAQRVLNYRTVIDFPDQIFHFEQPRIVIQEILNMFILRPPPVNPRRLSDPYFEEKFRAHADKVLLRAGAAELVPTDVSKGDVIASMAMTGLPPVRRGEIQTAALEFQASAAGKLLLRFVKKDDGKPMEITYRADPGTTRFYIGLPAERVSTLQVLSADGAPASVTVQSLEVRSDRSP